MSKDYRKRSVRIYDATAGLYDLMEFFRKGTRDAVVRASECKPSDCVLDICAGTGELARAFAKHGIRVVALDLARGMLRVGKHKSSFQHLSFVQADATRLPFADQSFDAVTVSLALHHMPETMQLTVMKEMARLARKRVVTMEYHTPQNRHWQTFRGFVIQLLDLSEYMQEWMHQDFAATCDGAGLKVKHKEVLTMGLHCLTTCHLHSRGMET